MKLYKLKLLHNGKQNHQMTKEGVTAPEVVMLKAVHGPQAVENLEATGFNETINLLKEKARLIEKYGQKKFEEMFPGAFPVLPQDLAQLGIEAQHPMHELPFQYVGKSLDATRVILAKLERNGLPVPARSEDIPSSGSSDATNQPPTVDPITGDNLHVQQPASPPVSQIAPSAQTLGAGVAAALTQPIAEQKDAQLTPPPPPPWKRPDQSSFEPPKKTANGGL